jgi:hypothetical protein
MKLNLTMEASNFTLYLSSKDSISLFPENKPTNFTVKLPETIINTGIWVCALVDITTDNPSADDFFLVCTDIVQETIVRTSQYPILRRVFGDLFQLKEFDHWIYTTVKRKGFNTINIYILTDTEYPRVANLEQILINPDLANVEEIEHREISEIRCTLHFKRIK